jgi:hypothetical protein
LKTQEYCRPQDVSFPFSSVLTEQALFETVKFQDSDTMHQWRAEPQAINARQIYRGPMQRPDKNIMHDKRIKRGNTYAPSGIKVPVTIGVTSDPGRTRQVPAPPIKVASRPAATSTQMSSSNYVTKPISGVVLCLSREILPMYIYIGPQWLGNWDIPMTVEGRVDSEVQTVDFLEDLREHNNTESVTSQTDILWDLPTEPLFTPMSSGVDVATHIEPGDLFDFPLEVSPILDVIMDRSVSEALMEVLEEEELKEIAKYRSEFLQERNTMLATVQRMEAKEQREAMEAVRRKQQAQQAVEADAARSRELTARAVAKDFFNNLTDNMVTKMDHVGFFYDPSLKQVLPCLDLSDILS